MTQPGEPALIQAHDLLACATHDGPIWSASSEQLADIGTMGKVVFTTRLASRLMGMATPASGAFGQSDDVLFRIEAYPTPLADAIRPPGTYTYPNVVADIYQHASISATTFPFRVRGTQVRVMQGDTPQPNALVYRLKRGQNGGGSLVGSAGYTATTNPQGYLRGRGQLLQGDHLLALVPITPTSTYSSSYSLYMTSGRVTADGLQSTPIEQFSEQKLEVSPQTLQYVSTCQSPIAERQTTIPTVSHR